MNLVERAEREVWAKGKPDQPGRYLCSLCGVRYFRREQYEVWSVTQTAKGLVYDKHKIRICLECAAEDRPRKFARMGGKS